MGALNLGIWSCRGGLRQGACPQEWPRLGEEQSPLRKGSQSLRETGLSPHQAPCTLVSCVPGDGQTSPCDEKPQTGTGMSRVSTSPVHLLGEGSPSPTGAGRPGLKDKGRRGQGKELVAELNGSRKKKHKTENYGET